MSESSSFPEVFSKEEIEKIVSMIENRANQLAEFGFNIKETNAQVVSLALPLPVPVLEIATGKGRFLAELARHVPHVVTVDTDPSEQRIARIYAHAKGVADRITFVTADATHLDFPDHSFGSIVSMNTFHHVEQPGKLLDEMRRLVRSDGKIVISDFDEQGFEVMEKLHAAENRVHPRGAHSMQEIAHYWRQHGWTVELKKAHCQDVVIAYGPAAKGSTSQA